MIIYKDSDFKVFTRMTKDSWSQNTVYACKAYDVYKNFVENLAGWNQEYQSTN